jgi:hypothetical protein
VSKPVTILLLNAAQLRFTKRNACSCPQYCRDYWSQKTTGNVSYFNVANYDRQERRKFPFSQLEEISQCTAANTLNLTYVEIVTMEMRKQERNVT